MNLPLGICAAVEVSLLFSEYVSKGICVTSTCVQGGLLRNQRKETSEISLV
jgi:hypothetical protein